MVDIRSGPGLRFSKGKLRARGGLVARGQACASPRGSSALLGRLFDLQPTKLSGLHIDNCKTKRGGGSLNSAELVRGPRPGCALESSTIAIRRDPRFC